MIKNPRIKILIAFGICAIGGSICVLATQRRRTVDGLSVASWVALLLGVGGFLAFVVSLIREGTTPLSEKDLENGRRIGAATGYMTVTLFFWGCVAAGLANIIGLRGGAYWSVIAAGVVIGSVRCVRKMRNQRRGRHRTTDISDESK